MHLGIPLPVLILSGTWCTDQGGIHDGAPTEFQALLLKGLSHQREQSAPQMVAFQEMTELAQGGLIRHGSPAQVDHDKPAHRLRVVERFLRRRIRQVEPVLQKVNAQQAFHVDRRPAAPLILGVKRFNRRRELRLGNDAVPLFKKPLASRELAGPLETFFGKNLLAHAAAP